MGDLISSVEVYNVDLMEWSKGPELPVTLMSSAALSLGSYIILTGGEFDREFVDKVRSDLTFILDTDNERLEWRESKRKLCHARYDHSASFLLCTGEVYVFGGRRPFCEGVDTIEKISAFALLDLKWFVLLRIRLLVLRDRAIPLVLKDEEEEVSDLMVVRDFICNTNDDIFRTIMEQLY